MSALSRSERGWRAGISLTCLMGLIWVRWIDPAAGSGWTLSNPLTQRIFGLPCPFCGMTRGTHAMLNGRWLEMFYLNPATLAVVLAGSFLCVVWLAEAVRGQAVWEWGKVTAWLQRRWFLWFSCLVLFWVFQVVVAVIGPKPELLSPEAPFFPSFLF